MKRALMLAGIIAAMCIVGGLLAVGGSAGEKSATLTGIVRDQSGAPLANATVMAIDLEAGSRQMTVSDEHGRFELKKLRPGRYDLDVMRPRFKNFEISNTNIEPGSHRSPEIRLEPGFTPLIGGTTRLRVGGNVQQSKLVTQVRPVYLESELRAHISGNVILFALIGKDGTPLSLTVLDVGDNPELARAAVEAVQHWRYRPTLLNGNPVEVQTTILVVFTIGG